MSTIDEVEVRELVDAVDQVALYPAAKNPSNAQEVGIVTNETPLEEVFEAEVEEVDVKKVNCISEPVVETEEVVSNNVEKLEISQAEGLLQSMVGDADSALVADMKKLKQAIASEGLPVHSEAPKTESEGTSSPATKLSKGQKKNQKKAQKKAEETAKPSTTTESSTEAAVQGITVIAELPSPEEQHKLSKLQKQQSSNQKSTEAPAVTQPEIAATEAPKPTVDSAETPAAGSADKKKKKPTSTERRALRDARQAEAAAHNADATGTAGTTATPSPASLAHSAAANKVAEPAVQTAPVAEDGSTKAKKQRSKKGQADGAASTPATPAVPTVLASTDTTATSKKAAAEAPKAATAPTTVSAVPAGITAKGSTETNRKPLASEEREARKAAKAAAARATPAAPALTTAVIANSTSSALTGNKAAAAASAPLLTQHAEEPNKKRRNNKQENAANNEPPSAGVYPSVAPASKSAQTPKTATSAPAPTSAPAAANAAVTASTTKTSAATVNLPGLKPDQRIVMHSAVTVLLQTLRTGDSVLYTQHGALKLHLLTEMVKLGYVGIEGNATAYQKIVCLPQGLSYSDPIKNDANFPALKARGDVKIEQPGLCLQVTCYPMFGSDSPKMAGLKTFKNGFLKHLDEVAMAETDVFLFVLAAEVYTEFALKAAPTLPEMSTIQNFSSSQRMAYVTRKEMACKLNTVLCKIDAGYGEFVVGAVHA